MEQNPAFQALLTVANRSRLAARGLPEREQAQREWSGVGFGLMGHRFVVPMGQVSELLELPNYTKLPGVKSWIKGVANVRGRLLPIMDLAAFLGHRLLKPQKQQRILVVESDDLYCGMLVDQSFGVQHFLSETYESEQSAPDDNLQPFLMGSYRLDGGMWYVFSMVNLVQNPAFMAASRVQAATA
jgi:twitching motility protein PilI